MEIGCHGLVWTGEFDEAGMDLAIRNTREAGFDLLEIPLLDPYALDVEAAKRSLGRDPITLTASLGLPAHADVTSLDREQVAAGEALLTKALEVLDALGGTALCGVIYSRLHKYPGPASPQARANSQEVLGRIAERAKGYGLPLALEVVNRYESNLFNTAAGALDFIREIGSDNIGVHLDTYHMNIEEQSMWQPVLDSADLLSYVHIGESHRGYLGTGTVDFESLFRALTRIGYDGPIVFESFSSAVVHPDLSNDLAVWRNLWDDGLDLGRHANDFIRNRVRASAQAAAL